MNGIYQMSLNVRRLEVYLSSKQQFNGRLPSLDDLFILSVTNIKSYQALDNETIKSCLIDSQSFKIVASELKKNQQSSEQISILNDSTLKTIIDILSANSTRTKHPNRLNNQLNSLKEVIIHRTEDEIIYGFIY